MTAPNAGLAAVEEGWSVTPEADLHAMACMKNSWFGDPPGPHRIEVDCGREAASSSHRLRPRSGFGTRLPPARGNVIGGQKLFKNNALSQHHSLDCAAHRSIHRSTIKLELEMIARTQDRTTSRTRMRWPPSSQRRPRSTRCSAGSRRSATSTSASQPGRSHLGPCRHARLLRRAAEAGHRHGLRRRRARRIADPISRPRPARLQPPGLGLVGGRSCSPAMEIIP